METVDGQAREARSKGRSFMAMDLTTNEILNQNRDTSEYASAMSVRYQVFWNMFHKSMSSPPMTSDD